MLRGLVRGLVRLGLAFGVLVLVVVVVELFTTPSVRVDGPMRTGWISTAWRHFRQGVEPDLPLLSADTSELTSTVVMATLDSDMPAQKSAVWSAAVPLAWSHLTRFAGGPVSLADADPDVARLNAGAPAEDELPADGAYGASGLVRDGIREQIQAEMGRRFPDVRPRLPVTAQTAAISYGFLRARMRWPVPYLDQTRPIGFPAPDGKLALVSAFGVVEERGYEEMRKQADVIYMKEVPYNPVSMVMVEWAVNLAGPDAPYSVIAASIPRPRTLAAGVAYVAAGAAAWRLKNPARRGIGGAETLLVPNMNWRIEHRFPGLTGTLRSGQRALDGLLLEPPITGIQFRLDRLGFAAEGEAVMIKSVSIAPRFVCDAPFLLYVKRREASRPFLAMWIANSELLVPAGDGLTPARPVTKLAVPPRG